MNPIREVYFDCAASAPMLRSVREMLGAWQYANPNSVHSAGRNAREILESARAVIAECIGAKPREIYFTPSATAACHDAVRLLKIWERSPHEHQSVVNACVNQTLTGSHDPDATAHILASNETGEIFSGEVMRLVRQGKTVFTDATAAMGHYPIDVRHLGVAALAAGAHKFGGPPGIGFLYVKDGVAECSFSERDFSFPGTPPVALAAAMAEALLYRVENMDMGRALSMREDFQKRLLQIPGAHINRADKPRLPHIVSVRFDGVNARELLTLLDVNGVCASAGSACHADSDKPSEALLAAGLSHEQALQTIRLSFCEETFESECREVAQITGDCVERLRTLGGIPMP